MSFFVSYFLALGKKPEKNVWFYLINHILRREIRSTYESNIPGIMILVGGKRALFCFLQHVVYTKNNLKRFLKISIGFQKWFSESKMVLFIEIE